MSSFTFELFEAAGDLGSTHVSTVNPLCYRDLRKYLALAEKPARVKDVVAQLTEIDEDIIKLFHVDLLDVNRHLPPAPGNEYYKDVFLPMYDLYT